MTDSSLAQCGNLARLAFFALLGLAGLSGCAAINIQDVDPDQLDIKVRLNQGASLSELDVFLTRGLWAQPVRMNGAQISVAYADGSTEALIASNQRGRYGLRSRDSGLITDLQVDTVGRQSLPLIAAVRISEDNSFDGQTFFKDDVITLNLTESAGDERYLIASGRCGNTDYSSAQKITDRATTLTVKLGDIMKRVNNAAEADLNGIIPITLTLEERYQPIWTPPFKIDKLAASDSVQFQIDTSGFRVRAEVRLQVGNSLMMQFQNQTWDTQFCL